MKFFKILVCVLSLVVASQSNAAIIDFTDNGDITVVNDNGQVTEWLDLTITTDLSFDDVDGFLADGSLDEVIADSELAAGWRIASLAEVIAMTNLYFGVWDNVLNQIVFDYSESTISSFINLFGDTFEGAALLPPGMVFSTQGFTNDDVGATSKAAVQILGFGRNQVVHNWSVFPDGQDASVGAWLVREPSQLGLVNAPASLALFILAITGMLRSRRV